MQVLEYEANETPQRPMVELLKMALPTVAQMASYTVMHFIDMVMLSRVGDEAAAAARSAGMFSFTLVSFGFGVLLLVNTLVSQNYGQKDYRECGRYVWQGIWWAAGYAILILPLIALMPRVFRMLGHGPELVRMESAYFSIVIAASITKLVSTAVGDFLLAVNRPNSVLIAAVIGVVCNSSMAYYLMLAPSGPHIGVTGAAWAQNTGLAVELGVLVFIALRPEVRKVYNVLDWRPRWKHMRLLLSLGTPSGLQTVTDMLAWTLFTTFVMASFGLPALAATNYMFGYLIVSFMPCYGISAAVTALVGRYIGRGQPEVAKERAHLGFKVGAAYLLTCGTAYLVFRRPLIYLFSGDPEILRLGMTLMVFAAVFQLFDGMYVIYNGALRGAGDTFVPSIVTGVLVWGVMLFGGWAVARWYHESGVAGPWIVATVYGATLGLFMWVRFARGGWKRIHLEEESDANKVASTPEAVPVT